MSEFNEMLQGYLYTLKKVYYGARLFHENLNCEADTKIKYTNYLRDLVYKYYSLVQKQVTIPDVFNYEHQEFSIINGILYGSIEIARSFANDNINSTDVNMFSISIYIKCCIHKEVKTYITYPIGYTKSITQEDKTFKPVSNPLDLFNTSFSITP